MNEPAHEHNTNVKVDPTVNVVGLRAVKSPYLAHSPPNARTPRYVGGRHVLHARGENEISPRIFREGPALKCLIKELHLSDDRYRGSLAAQPTTAGFAHETQEHDM